nr:AAA family ATPase [Paracoccus aestuariivivens]
MLERDLQPYSAAQALSGPVIFDRGIPVIVGCLSLCGPPVPPHVVATAKAARYNRRVFRVPYRDEKFTQDTERKQCHAQAEATCAAMYETCSAFGYELTELLKRTSRAVPPPFYRLKLAGPYRSLSLSPGCGSVR